MCTAPTIFSSIAILLCFAITAHGQEKEKIMLKTFEEGIISLPDITENMITTTQDEKTVFFTRTDGWNLQAGYIGERVNGNFSEAIPVTALDSIYNGAISPDGTKIIYSVKKDGDEEIWLIKRHNGQWKNPTSLTESSNIEGGYFNWYTNDEVYLQLAKNDGDIARAKLENDLLVVQEELSVLNTAGTEFSPYVDKQKRFIVFTRYVEGNISQQGFFVSYNNGVLEKPNWSKPTKLEMLPYGWGAFFLEHEGLFLFSNGDDIVSCRIEDLKLQY